MKYLDEYANDELAAALRDEFGGTPAVRAELNRCDEVYKANALTGADLSYWAERMEIIRCHLSVWLGS
jgi:hypothetical protein